MVTRLRRLNIMTRTPTAQNHEDILKNKPDREKPRSIYTITLPSVMMNTCTDRWLITEIVK